MDDETKRIDRILAYVFEKSKGNSQTFICTVLDFMKRKTDFGLLDNTEAKEVFLKAIDRTMQNEGQSSKKDGNLIQSVECLTRRERPKSHPLL